MLIDLDFAKELNMSPSKARYCTRQWNSWLSRFYRAILILIAIISNLFYTSFYKALFTKIWKIVRKIWEKIANFEASI